jgi:Icc-related predicted phosphoesterase
MKILVLSDEVCPALYDYYTPGRLAEYDLIISCGDLKASYLSFIVTMARVPVLYVHGNHDVGYERNPPEGCDCIDDQLIVYKGVRILGLGGSRKYRDAPHQYTEKEMQKRIRRLRWKLWWHKGVDIVITHAPPEGVGSLEDNAHRGFDAFLDLIDKYHPKYLLHGHVHLTYARDKTREREYHGTQVINVSERYVLDYPEEWLDQSRKGDIEGYV